MELKDFTVCFRKYRTFCVDFVDNLNSEEPSYKDIQLHFIIEELLDVTELNVVHFGPDSTRPERKMVDRK